MQQIDGTNQRVAERPVAALSGVAGAALRLSRLCRSAGAQARAVQAGLLCARETREDQRRLKERTGDIGKGLSIAVSGNTLICPSLVVWLAQKPAMSKPGSSADARQLNGYESAVDDMMRFRDHKLMFSE